MACGALPPVPGNLCGLSVRVYLSHELLAPLWIISFCGGCPSLARALLTSTPALQSAYDTSVMLPSLSLLCLERLLLAGAAALVAVRHGLLAWVDRAWFSMGSHRVCRCGALSADPTAKVAALRGQLRVLAPNHESG